MLIANLIFLYHLIVASENLLRVAIACSRDERLKVYFEHHLKEETGHAQWLAEDLACVAIDVRHTAVPLIAAQAAGSVYYLIFHVHPAALLGYMRTLESWPMDKAAFAVMGVGYPPQLLRTLNYHIDHDPEHLRDLLEIIEALPDHRKLIEDVAIMTHNHLYQAARQIVPLKKAG